MVIEAMQYNGTEDIHEMRNFVGDDLDYDMDTQEYFISTLEGNMIIDIGDFVIKGIKGEFYPCKPDVFELSYNCLLEDQR